MDDQRQELRRWDQICSRIYCSCEKMHRLSLEKLSLMQVFQRVGDDTQKASNLSSISCQSCESCGMIVAFHLPSARFFLQSPKRWKDDEETCRDMYVAYVDFCLPKRKVGPLSIGLVASLAPTLVVDRLDGFH